MSLINNSNLFQTVCRYGYRRRYRFCSYSCVPGAAPRANSLRLRGFISTTKL